MHMPTIKRRGKTYHARAYVPSDLRQIVKRREVARSLTTVDYRQAIDRGAVWQGELTRLWSHLRQHSQDMTRDQIDTLIKHYVDSFWENREEDLSRIYDLGEQEAQARLGCVRERIAETESDAARNRLDSVEWLAAQLIRETDSEIAPGSDAFRRLCVRLLSVRVDLAREDGRRLLPTMAQSVVEQKAKPSPLLSAVIADYDRLEMATWRDRSAQMGRQGLKFFLECVGDKEIGEVTPSELREYQAKLRSLPGRRAQTLSPASITKHQSYVTGLFKWALDGKLIEINPAPSILKPERSNEADDELRDVFTDDELASIFGGTFRDNREARPERYWIPLLMLHTGARNEEIAQLHVSDVEEVEGVWCIDINRDTPDKQLKNKFSKRQTPIHPAVIESGFLAYVDGLRDARTERLWPTLTKGNRGYNAPVSRWFNRRLDELGLKTPKKDSYSLRHTFSNKLKQQGVAEYIIDRLTGHKSEGISVSRYGKRVDPKPLLEVVRALPLPWDRL
jgi:integrase